MNAAWFTARQNQDGGWGYVRDGSATEPTAYALLALAALDEAGSDGYRRGLSWLANMQMSDGGWPPRPCVAHSTWVTALPLLASANLRGADAAVRWLLAQSGRESSMVERLKTALKGEKSGVDVSSDGWPWFPGAAAWVMPTSLTLLALRKQANAKMAARLRSGCDFLLSRRCADGGWNHGASRALGYEAESYPETTGIALLALAATPATATTARTTGTAGTSVTAAAVGTPAKAATGSTEPRPSGSGLARSIAIAESHLASTRSREAASWLQLALTAHGRPAAPKQFAREPRTVQEAALSTLADVALQGRNVLIA